MCKIHRLKDIVWDVPVIIFCLQTDCFLQIRPLHVGGQCVGRGCDRILSTDALLLQIRPLQVGGQCVGHACDRIRSTDALLLQIQYDLCRLEDNVWVVAVVLFCLQTYCFYKYDLCRLEDNVRDVLVVIFYLWTDYFYKYDLCRLEDIVRDVPVVIFCIQTYCFYKYDLCRLDRQCVGRACGRILRLTDCF
jgi:hypothetical protein